MRTAPCLIECGGRIVTRRDTSTCLSSVGFGRITNHPDISSIVGIFFGCMTNVFRQCYKFGKQVTSLPLHSSNPSSFTTDSGALLTIPALDTMKAPTLHRGEVGALRSVT